VGGAHAKIIISPKNTCKIVEKKTNLTNANLAGTLGYLISNLKGLCHERD
jgi:hypothetical protein